MLDLCQNTVELWQDYFGEKDETYVDDGWSVGRLGVCLASGDGGCGPGSGQGQELPGLPRGEHQGGRSGVQGRGRQIRRPKRHRGQVGGEGHEGRFRRLGRRPDASQSADQRRGSAHAGQMGAVAEVILPVPPLGPAERASVPARFFSPVKKRAVISEQRAFCFRSEEHTSELQSHSDLVCRLLLEKKKNVHLNGFRRVSRTEEEALSSFVVLAYRRSHSFFFNDTATTEIYTLSLHDALPILKCARDRSGNAARPRQALRANPLDRKSTRLNSSHTVISYAVFCLKKKKQKFPVISLSHYTTKPLIHTASVNVRR